MRQPVDNRELFNKKLLVFKNKFLLEDFTYHFHYFIHGIKITFLMKNSEPIPFLDKLSHKCNNYKEEITVYLETPSGINMSDEFFCSESSQDCFENSQGAIQRDFIAKPLGNKRYYSVFSLEHFDGIYNFLRWLLPPFMLEFNEAILHSSAVVTGPNRAILFLGYSGAGKTTIASLAGDRLILGDDMNRVLIKNQSVYASAGSVGGAFKPVNEALREYEVERVYWLKQANENQISQIPLVSSYQKLFSSLVGWNWIQEDKRIEEKMLNFAELILNKVQLKELNFKKDTSVWSFLEGEK